MIPHGNMKIDASGIDHGYQDVIRQFLQQEMPNAEIDKADGLEAVFNAIISTKNLRYGPKPNIESQFAIREVIAKAIQEGKPIPVVLPWGSRKPDLARIIDVAEMSAIRTIMCIQDTVKRYYEPGLHVRVRIEDAGGLTMFAEREPLYPAHSKRYTTDVVKLINIMNRGRRNADGSNSIEGILESTLMTPKEHYELAHKLADLFEKYLLYTDEFGMDSADRSSSYAVLTEEYGFRGPISQSQRDYYRERYRKHYPGKPEHIYTRILAEYMGSAVARIKLNATGNLPEWGQDFIKFQFASPIPGTPASVVGKNIHYRTVPLRSSHTHIPPWRAFGYLRVSDNDEHQVTPAVIATRNVSEVLPGLIEGQVTLSDGWDTLDIATPLIHIN